MAGLLDVLDILMCLASASELVIDCPAMVST